MVRVGEVIVQGNYFTRDSVVHDTLTLRKTGDVLDPEQLASATDGTFTVWESFAAFRSSPRTTTGESRGHCRACGREAGGGELQYGVGYDTRGPGVHKLLADRTPQTSPAAATS